MSMVHDAYLFRPEEFAREVLSNWQVSVTGPDRYKKLRAHTLELHHTLPHVRVLCSEYGGWDRTALTLQLPAEQPRGPEDVAFWFVLLLYGHLANPAPHELGFGDHTDLIGKVIGALGWSNERRSLLMNGRTFKQLIESSMLETGERATGLEADLECWDHFRPPATSAKAGWLGAIDVIELLDDVARIRPKLSDIEVQHSSNLDPDSTNVAFKAITKVLATAKEANSGLCVIVSG